ncbi:MAG: class I SAM-dependent methyltransferase [Sphingomonadales bacterium]|nr:class I SAM-dependent methyltransferase [Sphingomonadales bacterium]MDE2570056.1 class I SAM-dependent methyltransferase [Sphingomonadales bacterium]
MGFKHWYDEHVVPRLIRCACSSPAIMDLREKVIPLATGKVFELGCGGGINQRYYDRDKVTAFSGIDPTAKLLDYAREQIRRKGWEADIRAGKGEAIPFGDAEFDTVVCTYTLCSVEDPARVLSEMRRVLKPGGKFLFLEHGSAPDAGVRKWQGRIEPVWKRMAGGCHLTRQVGGAVLDGGFLLEEHDCEYAPKTPKWAGWMEWGVAVKAG